MLPYIVKIRIMTCYMYIDGKRQEIDEDLFEQMTQELHPLNQPITTTSTRWDVVEPLPTTRTGRWKPDGTYNKKPLDPEYFTKYYHNKLSTPFTCPDYGRTISSKSNLSKHRQSHICRRNRK